MAKLTEENIKQFLEKHSTTGKVIEKLAEYERLEEQGLLLRLPFRIGQKVYYIYESCIDGSLMIGSMVFGYSCLDFPRTYYATKEEAEQKLAEMKWD